MIAICLRCNREHVVGGLQPGAIVHCSCGNGFEVPQPKPFYPQLLRCGGCGGSIDARAARCEYCNGAVKPFDVSRYCVRCYAFLTADAEFCSLCGAKALHAAKIPETSKISCPRDGTALKGVPIGSIHGEECSECGGVWLRKEHFDEIAQTEARHPAEGEKYQREQGRAEFRREVRYLNCPECGTQMARQNYKRVSGVIIDICRQHGVWLDKHELYDVGAFLRRGGLSRAQAFLEEEDARNAASRCSPSAETQPSATLIAHALRDLLKYND